jgi:hypothetical protein
MAVRKELHGATGVCAESGCSPVPIPDEPCRDIGAGATISLNRPLVNWKDICDGLAG